MLSVIIKEVNGLKLQIEGSYCQNAELRHCCSSHSAIPINMTVEESIVPVLKAQLSPSELQVKATFI